MVIEPPAGVSALVGAEASASGTREMPLVLPEGLEVVADEERRNREEEERENEGEREREEAAAVNEGGGGDGDGGRDGGADERSGEEERVERGSERAEERAEGPSCAPEVAAAGSSRGGATSCRGGGRGGAMRRVVVPPQVAVTRGAGRRRGNEPKDKGIATSEERPRGQRRVCISREDYAVHAAPEVVAQLAQENPLLREVVREEIVQEREREMAQALCLQEEDEAMMAAASVLAEEFEEEEALREAQEQEEERAQGRVTVVQMAQHWLRSRPGWVSA